MSRPWAPAENGFVLAGQWHRPRSIALRISKDPLRWTLKRRAAWQHAALLLLVMLGNQLKTAAMQTQPERASLIPNLILNLRSGYGWSFLRKDALAGLTVAIVALPLSMAIAIASHAPPQAGLFTAIIGGFLISALGGSRYQIGGPAGAFIVLLASIIDKEGMQGLLLATLMAGVLILAMGLLRLGNLVRYVPHPVITGFTAGIAVIILTSQLKDLFGLSLPDGEPAALWPKLQALASAAPTFNSAAVLVSSLSIVSIVVLRRFTPRIPALLAAVVACTLLAFVAQLQTDTIFLRFGAVPTSLPWPILPNLSPALLWRLAPDAVALALLGAIESLLSAVVADNMTGERHNANMELVAQGTANVAVALFGGITATGTIARTATNVKAHAHGPVSGLLHALFLLLFMALAAPLLGYIPLAALAGILAVVSFNMVDWTEFGSKLFASRSNTLALMLTCLITIFADLLSGIAVGTIFWWALHALSLTNKADSDANRP